MNTEQKARFNIWLANSVTGLIQPRKPKANVLIADFSRYPPPLRCRNKVRVDRFFPHFCQRLSRHEFASVFVHDCESLQRNLRTDGTPNILINLLVEGAGNWIYTLPQHLEKSISLIFNSRRLGDIVGCRKITNTLLAEHGISVPKQNPPPSGQRKIFSLGGGYPNSATVTNTYEQLESGRYNVEFIDTRIAFQNKTYFTSLRMMCIGSRVVKFIIRARDCEEQRPEARDRNTPPNPNLIDHIYQKIVTSNQNRLLAMVEDIEAVYGPGFYAHDIVLDKDTGIPYLCETELKFFPDTYTRTFRGLLDDTHPMYSTMSYRNYAKRAANKFADYCYSSI